MTSHMTIVKRWLLLLLLGMMLFAARVVHAMPSFSRQTGMPCAQCHINSFGPKLNSFGRNFKLTGYTLGDWQFPPLSGMLVAPSFTHASKDVPDPSPPLARTII